MLNNKKQGIYIHIPFCKSICNYCDFCKKKDGFYNHKEYVETLISEFEYNEKNIDNPVTIYIGGGTPSILELNALEELLKYINNKLDMQKIEEFTFEANPDDINENLLKILKKYKITRISLGVQSTNNDILKKIGRTHKIEDVEKNLPLISKYIENISLDFMFNLPYQEMKDIENSIQFIKKHQKIIKHISYYSLIIEEHTQMFNSLNKKELNLAFQEDEEAKIYNYIQNELKKLGYAQYEISNFSQKNYYSRHNMLYWNRDEYLGLGLGASGYLNDTRYTNTASYKNYQQAIKSNKLPFIKQDKIENWEKLEESIFLGLRTVQGINLELLTKNNLQYRKEYMNLQNNKIAIKPSYFFLSNNIIVDLLEQIDKRKLENATVFY